VIVRNDMVPKIIAKAQSDLKTSLGLWPTQSVKHLLRVNRRHVFVAFEVKLAGVSILPSIAKMLCVTSPIEMLVPLKGSESVAGRLRQNGDRLSAK